jgi:DNA-binding MarR family transcriptional regulator
MTRTALTHTIFAFICAYRDEHSFSPTVQEIATACDIGVATVTRHLDRMQVLGWVSREYGKNRSIVILKRLENS